MADAGDEPERLADKPPVGPGPKREVEPIAKAREETRTNIAFWLLAILSAIVVGTFLALAFDWAAAADVRDVVVVLIGPVVSLLGAATGFYYGERKGNGRP